MQSFQGTNVANITTENKDKQVATGYPVPNPDYCIFFNIIYFVFWIQTGFVVLLMNE